MCNNNDRFLCPSSDNELCTLAPGTSTCESGSEQVCQDPNDCPDGISCELNDSKEVGICSGTNVKIYKDALCCTKDKVSLDNTQHPPIPTCCKQHENPFPKGNGCCKGEVTITGNCCKSDEIATTNGDCCNHNYVVTQKNRTFCCTSSALEGSTVSISEHKDRCYSITNYAGITEDKKTCNSKSHCKYSNSNKDINAICYNDTCRIQCGEYNLVKIQNPGSGPEYIPKVTASKIDNSDNKISACAMNAKCTFNPSPQFSPVRGGAGKDINILNYNSKNWWKMEGKTNKKDYTSTITYQFNPGSRSQCKMDDCLYALVKTPQSIGSKNIFKKPTKHTHGGCTFEYDGNDFGGQWPNFNPAQAAPIWDKSRLKYTGTKDCRTNECRYLQTGIYCEQPKRSYDGRTCVSNIEGSGDLCNRSIYKNHKGNKAQIDCQMPNGDSINKYENVNDVYYIRGDESGNPQQNKKGWLYYKSKLNKYTPTSGPRTVNEFILYSGSMYDISGGNPPYKLARTTFAHLFNFFNSGAYGTYTPDKIFDYTILPDLTKSIFLQHGKVEMNRYEYSMFLKKGDNYLTFDTNNHNFKLVADKALTNLLLTVNFGSGWSGQNNGYYDYGINTSIKNFSHNNSKSSDVFINLSKSNTITQKLSLYTKGGPKITNGSSIFPIYNPDNQKWALVSIPLAIHSGGSGNIIPYGSNIFYLSTKYTFKQYMLCGGGRGGGHGGSTSCRPLVCPSNWGYYCEGISKSPTSSIWPGLSGFDFPINTDSARNILWFDNLDIFSHGLPDMANDDFLIKNQNNTTNSFTNTDGHGHKSGYNKHFSVPNNVYNALESNFDIHT